MALAALSCPTCGGRDVRRRAGGFACGFCGGAVVPRLLPDTVCGDGGGGCTAPAQSLCRGCARPLCDRHNDPKFLYWNSPFAWRRLLPRWDGHDARDWSALTTPFQSFPVPGFAPFPWTAHERKCLYEVGEVEEQVLGAVRRAVAELGGDANENGYRLASVCAECEADAASRIEAEVAGFAERYRVCAYENRLDALEADLEQARRYVEAFLGGPVAGEGAADEEGGAGLSLDGPREDWERCGREVLRRLALCRRLASRLR